MATQLLVLDPASEMRYTGPFTKVVTSELKLENPTERKVCFKVKTTNPKQYTVLPNNGIIDAGNTANVLTSLQPFDYKPSEKYNHKFLIQAMFAPDEPYDESLWKETSSKDIKSFKLTCVFELPVEKAGSSPFKSGGKWWQK